jgi:glycosyltransferase involved in cell wall biosynthesis
MPVVSRRLSLPVFPGCGWQESLRTALAAEDSVTLGMAAVGPVAFEPFEEDGVSYFHVDAGSMPRGLAGVAAAWRRPGDDAALLARASSLVDEFRPDVVHVHGCEGPFGLLAESASVPVLISLQGSPFACSRAYFSGIPATDVAREVATVGFLKGEGFLHTYRSMRYAAEREIRILRACEDFAGRTEWDKGIVRVAHPGARYHHADEVLRSEFYVAGRTATEEHTPAVIYSTLGAAPYKGLVDLLEAFALLRASTPRPLELRVGGQLEGTSMWRVARRAIVRLRLQESVRLLGGLDPDGVISELQAASMYVHPSVVENSPNSLAEAMMLGVPCVAAAAGGVPSMLRHGREGLLCAPNDVLGLAAAMATLADDADLAASLGENARVRARERHDRARVARTMAGIYADVASRERGR